jgi:hypothetical protein
VPAAAVLIVAGFQVPGIPLLEVAGNVGATVFWQMLAIAVNVGVTSGSIVTLSVAVAAHCPAVGVNVYVVVPGVAVFIVAGLQVPGIPLFDVPGNIGATVFWQILAIAVNVGVTSGLMVILNVAVVAH